MPESQLIICESPEACAAAADKAWRALVAANRPCYMRADCREVRELKTDGTVVWSKTFDISAVDTSGVMPAKRKG